MDIRIIVFSALLGLTWGSRHVIPSVDERSESLVVQEKEIIEEGTGKGNHRSVDSENIQTEIIGVETGGIGRSNHPSLDGEKVETEIVEVETTNRRNLNHGEGIRRGNLPSVDGENIQTEIIGVETSSRRNPNHDGGIGRGNYPSVGSEKVETEIVEVETTNRRNLNHGEGIRRSNLPSVDGENIQTEIIGVETSSRRNPNHDGGNGRGNYPSVGSEKVETEIVEVETTNRRNLNYGEGIRRGNLPRGVGENIQTEIIGVETSSRRNPNIGEGIRRGNYPRGVGENIQTEIIGVETSSRRNPNLGEGIRRGNYPRGVGENIQTEIIGVETSSRRNPNLGEGIRRGNYPRGVGENIQTEIIGVETGSRRNPNLGEGIRRGNYPRGVGENIQTEIIGVETSSRRNPNLGEGIRRGNYPRGVGENIQTEIIGVETSSRRNPNLGEGIRRGNYPRGVGENIQTEIIGVETSSRRNPNLDDGIRRGNYPRGVGENIQTEIIGVETSSYRNDNRRKDRNDYITTSNHYEIDIQGYKSNECRGRYRDGNLEVVYSWNVLPFNIPRRYQGSLPSSRRQYISGLSVAKDRIFLATGGVFGRVPVTFATVPKHSCTKSPILEPYPNFDWHVEAATRRRISDCNRAFVTVYRSRLDSCNRIWVLDTGSQYLGDSDTVIQICPPKIVIFDLATDQPVRIITIPESVTRPKTVFNGIILDHERLVGGRYRSCDDSIVYLLDTEESAVIVYDSAKDIFSRVSNELIQPEPRWGIHHVAGESYTALYGVISQALRGDGRLYLQPFATNRIYSMKTSDLQRSLYVRRSNPFDSTITVPVNVEFAKPCTAVGMELSPKGRWILYGPLCEYALIAWDAITKTSTRLTPRNKEILQVIEDIKIDDSDWNKVWMITSREQKYFLDEVNPNEENQRLILVDLPKI